MPFLIILLVVVAALIVYGISSSSKAKKQRGETIERRKNYVASIGPNTRIVVNNGIHLFFKDDVKQIFGVDETGKTYSFSGLQAISRYKDGLSLVHDHSFINIGKDVCHQETTIAMDPSSVSAIYSEMMPVLRQNLRTELAKEGIVATHQYEVDGNIFGCDTDSQHFYCVAGAISIYRFSELKRVTIDDLSNNNLCSANYEVNIYVKHDDITMDQYPEYTIYFDTQDSNYYNILAMFKGIRNRQGF